MDAFRLSKNGKPKLLIAKTIIGKGIDEVAGTNAAHGNPLSLSPPLSHSLKPWALNTNTAAHGPNP